MSPAPEPDPQPTAAPKNSAAALHELRRNITTVRDEQLMRVVAAVDALPDRGAADTLLVMMRPRLAQLRPPRPLTFQRLLLAPLDPMILEPQKWRRDGLGIPRTIIATITSQLREVMGQEATACDHSLVGITADDGPQILHHGAGLWRQASQILPNLAPPPDWTAATGLGAADHACMVRLIGAIVAQGEAVGNLRQQTRHGLPLDLQRVRAILSTSVQSVANHGTDLAAQVSGTMLCILLARLPGADQVILAASDMATSHADAATRAAAYMAIDFVLNGLDDPDIASLDLSTAAAEVTIVAGFLNALQQLNPVQRASRKSRAERLRRQIDGLCRHRFNNELATRVMAPIMALGEDATDDEVNAIEAFTRSLRSFETACRELAGAAHYDTMIREATERLTSQSATKLPVPDLARVIEILVGPEAAMNLLGRRGVVAVC